MGLKIKEMIRKFECYQNKLINLGLTEEIIGQHCKEILLIAGEYPKGHPFKEKDFLENTLLYQLAICRHICGYQLKNDRIVDEYLKKKLVSAEKEKFNWNLFNQNLSEILILIYLIIRIYIIHDNQLKTVLLEYEPVSSNNSKLEYSFICEDNTKINIEVKTLDCDPLHCDSDKLRNLDLRKDHILVKQYFKNIPINEEKLTKIIKNHEYIKIKSNYRQVCKNIGKIKRKYEGKDKENINIGFLVINLGTSREEYISYLLHPTEGVLKKNGFGSIDTVVLFSDCHDRDIMLDNLYNKDHVISATEGKKNRVIEVNELLGIDRYILNGDKREAFVDWEKDSFGIYICRNINKCLTILPYFMSPEEIEDALIKRESISKSVLNYNVKVCNNDGYWEID